MAKCLNNTIPRCCYFEGFQAVVGGPWEAPVPLQGVHKLQTTFIIMLSCCLRFHCADLCTDDSSAKVGKTAGFSAPVTMVPANCPVVTVFFTEWTSSYKTSVYLRISWTKQQNNYFYLNLDPECKSVQCSVWWKWSVAKALLLSLRLKEMHCVTIWVVSRTSCPLLGFSPENITMDYGYSDLSIWQNINAVNLSLKGKDWQYCSQRKNLNFKQKLELQKICICHYDMLPSIQRVF